VVAFSASGSPTINPGKADLPVMLDESGRAGRWYSGCLSASEIGLPPDRSQVKLLPGEQAE
jgi:hypothetical protein